MESVENLKNLKYQTLNKTLLEKFRKLLEEFSKCKYEDEKIFKE